MSLPRPINWLNEGIGSANYLLYLRFCQVVGQYRKCATPDEFIALFRDEIVSFEGEYPSLVDDFTIPQIKLQIYQQILGQLPIRMEVDDLEYGRSEVQEVLDLSLQEVTTTMTPLQFIEDPSFMVTVWECLSLGLKICNYQDKAITAMRETMSREWILAQESTDMFRDRSALIHILAKNPGEHKEKGFEGLGSLFG